MAKTKEIKPDTVETFSFNDLSKKLPSVPDCKTLSTALERMFRDNQCKAIVSTWKNKIEYKFRFHKYNDPDFPNGAIYLTVVPELNRISLAIVGKKLTDADKHSLWNTVPHAVRTIIFRHYRHRKLQTIEALLEAALYIKACLNDIDSSIENISRKKQTLEKICY